MTSVLRVAEAHARTYRRNWYASMTVAFVSPALFLAAMGLGLGSLVDAGGGHPSLGGLSYVDFLAPGLVAATALQLAGSEGTFPVMHGTTWGRTYSAMLATPVSAIDVALGHLAWVGVRMTMTATAMVFVVALFGAVSSPLGLLAVPAAVLTGLSLTGVAAAYAVGLRSPAGLAGLNRFVVMPMFLFSGTFFPVEELPDWAELVAWLTPPFHGVELCRGLMTDDITLDRASLHVAYLLAWTVVGAWIATRKFQKRLVV
jgi:lipooligosaccharide transport system permease protein